MALERGTPEGNFVVEIDGIGEFRAMRVAGGVETNNFARIGEGNSPFELKVRNTTSVDDLTIEVAMGRYESAMDQLRQWRRDVRDGVVTRRNVRRVIFDETGRTPVNTIQYLNCLPASVSPADQAARGDNGAMVTIVLTVESVED
jgi:phage tail-like protein